jgi:hypothetical protein
MLKSHNSLPDSDISISQVFINIRNWEIKLSSSKSNKPGAGQR